MAGAERILTGWLRSILTLVVAVFRIGRQIERRELSRGVTLCGKISH
jgi:hypothetical protein